MISAGRWNVNGQVALAVGISAPGEACPGGGKPTPFWLMPLPAGVALTPEEAAMVAKLGAALAAPFVAPIACFYGRPVVRIMNTMAMTRTMPMMTMTTMPAVVIPWAGVGTVVVLMTGASTVNWASWPSTDTW